MPLPEGYILRHPALDEAPAIQALMDAAESVDTGEPRRHENDVATEWKSADCHPAEDWWVAVAPDGAVAAVAWIWPETAGEVTADHYVHPEHRGRGLGETMLDMIEARGAELPSRTSEGAARRLVVWCEDSDAERRASLDRRGFAAVRQYFEMADRPERRSRRRRSGLRTSSPRGLRPGRSMTAVYEADLEAFAEHHLYEPRDYDEWRLLHVDAPGRTTSRCGGWRGTATSSSAL